MAEKMGIALLALALSGISCAAPQRPVTMPEVDIGAQVPARAPDVRSTEARLVPYPGLDVSYVANTDGEVYFYRELFYTYFDGNWFYSPRVRGPWKFIEMKYVPPDLFRVRGHVPPSITSG